MDIAETQAFNYCIKIDISQFFRTSILENLGIHTDCGFAALMAFHTAGFVTQADENGASVTEIMQQTGHKKADTLRIYTRRKDAFRNASASVGI